MADFLIKHTTLKLELETAFKKLQTLKVDCLDMFSVVEALKSIDKINANIKLMQDYYPDICEDISVIELSLERRKKELQKTINIQKYYYDDIQ